MTNDNNPISCFVRMLRYIKMSKARIYRARYFSKLYYLCLLTPPPSPPQPFQEPVVVMVGVSGSEINTSVTSVLMEVMLILCCLMFLISLISRDLFIKGSSDIKSFKSTAEQTETLPPPSLTRRQRWRWSPASWWPTWCCLSSCPPAWRRIVSCTLCLVAGNSVLIQRTHWQSLSWK